MDGFLWGVISSIVASFTIWISGLLYVRTNVWSLEDYWIEEVDGRDADGVDGRIILSNFSYKILKGKYVYTGTSYTTDGTPEWTWTSPAVFIDQNEETVYYVYRAWREALGDQEHLGFGMIRYEKGSSTGRLKFTTGAFRGSLHGHLLHHRRLHRASSIVKKLKIKRGSLRDPDYQINLIQRFRTIHLDK